MHRALAGGREEAYKEGRSTTWRYIMLSREQSRAILRKIVGGKRPGKTLAVWVAAQSYAEWNTGRINATIEQLSEDADTPPTEVTRALSHLVELGGLVRTGRGRYAISPAVAWAGSLGHREAHLEGVE